MRCPVLPYGAGAGAAAYPEEIAQEMGMDLDGVQLMLRAPTFPSP